MGGRFAYPGSDFQSRTTIWSSIYGAPASQVLPVVKNTGGVTYVQTEGYQKLEVQPKDLPWASGVDLPGGVRVIDSGKVTTPGYGYEVRYPSWWDRNPPNYRPEENPVQPSYIDNRR